MSNATLRAGDVVAKKYEIESMVGEGPMGASYAARSIGAGKRVCIKIMAGESVGTEAAQPVITRVQSARSEALVPLLDMGEHAGSLFVATEYFEAESLRRLMDSYAGERRPFTLQEACQIVVRVLEAVDAAHQNGLVHRHVKPANVLVHTRLVGPGGGKSVRTIKLNGLGLCELLAPGTLAENIAERPDGRYMAPELASPSAGGTVQTDIYSVGVIFYELLTGQTPMGTYLSPTQVRDDLPKHVDDIVDVAIAGSAEDRYPSARDMINDIQRAFTDDDKPPIVTSTRTIAAIVGVCVLVLGSIVGYSFLQDPVADNRTKDEAARAKVINENQFERSVQEEKAKGHPNMVYIPAGKFISGRMRSEPEDVAPWTEKLATEEKVEAYYIDLFEFPNELNGFAIVNKTRTQAESACTTAGKRLCSSMEWERACKGPEQQIYGYGNIFAPGACAVPGGDHNKDSRLDRASGSQETCKSGWNVFDMSGGALEWTSSPGQETPQFGSVKGGELRNAERGSRCAFSEDRHSEAANAAIGFRCCMDDSGQLPTDPNSTPPVAPSPATP